jgi:hypothetical protein
MFWKVFIILGALCFVSMGFSLHHLVLAMIDE